VGVRGERWILDGMDSFSDDSMPNIFCCSCLDCSRMLMSLGETASINIGCWCVQI
jgi:hypothetical protein